MCTNRLHYLYQKLHQKLKLKSFLLIFASVMFLSACGIKGNLYQTPEQAVTPKGKVTGQRDASQAVNRDKSVAAQEKVMITLDESKKQQAVQQSIEQTNHSVSSDAISNQVIDLKEQATGQSTEQVKE